MRVLVGTLLKPETLAGIGNVCLLMVFVFIVFGIIGVNLFNSVLRNECFDAGEPWLTAAIPVWMIPTAAVS